MRSTVPYREAVLNKINQILARFCREVVLISEGPHQRFYCTQSIDMYYYSVFCLPNEIFVSVTSL